ncbi:ead/Ea22-like family protein [Klebsiella pneumoniae]|uniref:ead/Ea22-like family protein n=1 Tax=Klebsiella pneumoniae TaxID=573 RepID=UPI000DACF77E|nr:ead/Ea22-like family protein [Klebsiella pneumoniae]RAG88622.1 ead/Ea22-like family protein [Klebsiella pneumoniae]RAI47066.1 ead/Ea22-like family protein [Klebsiella pneumoniae]
MTTDITELAQSLKAAAEKATPGPWRRSSVRFNGITDIANPMEQGSKPHVANASEKRDAEFIALANPSNILALVEALEKAQQYAKERDAENQDLMLTVGRLRVEREELESRTVKLPPELSTIGELIRTQDNRITDQPMFVVFQKREIIGSDEHSPSRICWVWDGEEVSELLAKRLEALYQDGRDTRGYDRYAMQEVDEFVTACFTEHGCKDFLRQNGHNLRQPYIYACGSFRNNEYQLVRNWLAGIKVEAE